MSGWATTGIPHSAGWKRSVNPGGGVEGLGYRGPHARGRQGSLRRPAGRRRRSPRRRRRRLAARRGAAGGSRGDHDSHDAGRDEPRCERARAPRPRLGARSRPQPVGCLRLCQARLDLRPDPRALLLGHDPRACEGHHRPCTARRREEGDAQLGRRLVGRRRSRTEGRPRTGDTHVEAEARPPRQAVDAAADLHLEAAARRRREALPREDPGHRDGKTLQVVDVLGLEAYLKGVVPAEMPSAWSSEALKAQAVAARSYALASLAKGKDYDLYGYTRSQVYGGLDAELTATNDAVDATK